MSEYGHKKDVVAVVHNLDPAMMAWVEDQSSIPPMSTKETYWGAEHLLLDGDLGVYKLITMQSGCHSSMEFHRTKEEIYFLKSGKLRVNLITGRAERSCVELSAGQMFKIPPALCHQRVCLEDCVLLEWASSDNPEDTHLIEDGKVIKPWEPSNAG